MGSRFHCLLSLTAMVLILLSNPSSSCHEDQPSRCDSVSSFLIITDIKVDSLSLLFLRKLIHPNTTCLAFHKSCLSTFTIYSMNQCRPVFSAQKLAGSGAGKNTSKRSPKPVFFACFYPICHQYSPLPETELSFFQLKVIQTRAMIKKCHFSYTARAYDQQCTHYRSLYQKLTGELIKIRLLWLNPEITFYLSLLIDYGTTTFIDPSFSCASFQPTTACCLRKSFQSTSSHQMGTETPFELNCLPLVYDSIPIALCLPSFWVTHHSHWSVRTIYLGCLLVGFQKNLFLRSQPFLYYVLILRLGLLIRQFLLHQQKNQHLQQSLTERNRKSSTTHQCLAAKLVQAQEASNNSLTLEFSEKALKVYVPSGIRSVGLGQPGVRLSKRSLRSNPMQRLLLGIDVRPLLMMYLCLWLNSVPAHA